MPGRTPRRPCPPRPARPRRRRRAVNREFYESRKRDVVDFARRPLFPAASPSPGRMTMVAHVPPNFRRVIIAAAVGNVIEWYDFYIFGSLASVLAVKFFEKSHPVAALLSTIALFTAGFLIRPLGAFLFGWLGDRVGRKYTFLITLSGMGIGTGAIGLIPTYESIGLTAAFLLFALRMIQGLCLGGEYGGAITYVAEHVSDERRGFYTGWLQTSPTLGIVLSLAVIIGIRTYLGNDAFKH